MHQFRRFHHLASGATSYLICSPSGTGVFIDPLPSDIALYASVLEELECRLACIFETLPHPGADGGARALSKLTGASRACGGVGTIDTDIPLGNGDSLSFGDLLITSIATPGQAPGGMSYLWQDRLFTGQTLLIGGWGATDHPDADAGILYNSITQQLMGFPDEYLIYPGQTQPRRWVSCIGEERRTNPMLGGMSRDEFITLCTRTSPAAFASPIASTGHNFQALPTL